VAVQLVFVVCALAPEAANTIPARTRVNFEIFVSIPFLLTGSLYEINYLAFGPSWSVVLCDVGNEPYGQLRRDR
jgi:hypothetical protein